MNSNFSAKYQLVHLEHLEELITATRSVHLIVLRAAMSIAVRVTKSSSLCKILNPVLPQGHSEINCEESAGSLSRKQKNRQRNKGVK